MQNVAKALIKSAQVTIASANTPEGLNLPGVKTDDLILQADPSAAGVIRVGDADGQFFVVTAEGVALSKFYSNGVSRKVLLDDVMIQSSVAGDKLNILYSVIS